jgi:hypothetical protein
MANLAQKTSMVVALTSVVEPTDGAGYTVPVLLGQNEDHKQTKQSLNLHNYSHESNCEGPYKQQQQFLLPR